MGYDVYDIIYCDPPRFFSPLQIHLAVEQVP